MAEDLPNEQGDGLSSGRRPAWRRAISPLAAVLGLVAVFAGGYLAHGQGDHPVPADHTPGFSSPANQQVFGFLETEVVTRNEQLRPMPALADIYLCRGRNAVVDVTVEASGGPIEFDLVRSHREGPKRFHPRSVVHDATAVRRVISFTKGREGPFRRTRLALRFASPTGTPVTVHSASMHVTYRGARADLHRGTACGRADA